MTGLTRSSLSHTLQDKAAVLNESHKNTRPSNYGSRQRWSLRAAIPLWIGLAVGGWAAVVVSVYSFVRHDNEVAVIDKIDQPDRQLADEINRIQAIAPAAGADATTGRATPR